MLVAGAELIVRAGSKLAARLGVPPILIGLTVVSIGTSTPELAVGIEAALSGAGSLAVGNIAGTNIVNLLLILGLATAMRALPLPPQTQRLDVPVMGVAAMLVLLLAFDGVLGRVDGAILVAVAIAYTALLVWAARRPGGMDFPGPEEHTPAAPPRVLFAPARSRLRGIAVSSLVLIVGLAIIVLGATWLVDGAVGIARSFGISESFIGLTIIAIGTSAPELATAIISTIRGNRDIAIGNLLGSSTFNLTIILGIPLLVQPMQLEPELILIDLPMMILATFFVGVLMLTGRRLRRLEGVIMVATYFVYLAYLLIVRL